MAKNILDLVVAAAESKQAIDIVVLDVHKVSSVTDHLVICSGDSQPQLQAIERQIELRLRQNKIKKFNRGKAKSSGWIIVDLGNIVVHIMGQSERKYYNLEDLWGKEAVVYHY